jgi:serine/threonine protein kinase
MSLCINPSCPKAQTGVHQAQSLYCSGCGSPLLILDIYRVLEKLGTGGFGTTYLISDAGSKYVLKVLHNTAPKAIELFKQEAEVLKKLAHPGIPKVKYPSPFTYLPQGSSSPLHCLIMDYIEGQNLYDYLKKRNFQPISEPAALLWLRQLVVILHVVHRANYFHRDIKPENIMLGTDGKLVLIDFGTAREETLTYLCKQQGKPGTSINSVGYTPYEQQQGRAEPRSDFFALGRTFVFLLTGKTPREFEDSITQGLQWQNSASGYAKPLRDFLDLLMQPDVNKRPSNTAVILSTMQGLEKQLHPHYYLTAKSSALAQFSFQILMEKFKKITDNFILNTSAFVGDILGVMTRAFVSVFFGVIPGSGRGSVLSFIFGGIAYVFERVLSGFQALGEALWSLSSSFPWKGFTLNLISFAFMGYCISPWNRELIIFGILMIFFVISTLIFKAVKNKLFLFIWAGLFIFLQKITFMGVYPVIFDTQKQINIYLNLNLHSDFIANVVTFWFFPIVFSLIFFGLLFVCTFKNTQKYDCKNLVLQSTTLSIGLGIGWMIYQQVPFSESLPPLLEILKDLLKN